MNRTWTPPFRWVFLAATALGLFSTLQAYRLSSLNSHDPQVGYLLILNLSLWYIPAALTPIIFAITRRYPASGNLPRLLAVHVSAALVLSCVHAVGITGVRAALWGPPKTFGLMTSVQRQYLMNLDWALMTYTTIVGLTYALSYYREAQRRAVKEAQLETRLAEARLQALEAQLQPHFLFNTLHAISSLVHTNPEGADRIISRLSDLLRLTFDRAGAARVALQEELEFLEKYLEIEQTRFQDRLTVRYAIDPDTLDAEVPRLILQPLVENAIKHGISQRSGDGLVEIGARRDGDGLWLEVRDNGVGLAGRSRAQARSGVGLSNTRDRLDCLYGEAQSLECSEEPTGFTVRIRLPFSRSVLSPSASAILVA